MGQLIPWLQVTIPGFVYVTALFFFLLTICNKRDLDFNKSKEYFLYFAILTVFLSYVVGYAVHLTSEIFIQLIHPEFKVPLKNLTDLKADNDIVYQSINGSYSNLVMFRHLFLSYLFLAISLPVWIYKRSKYKDKWYISLITCLLFAVLFIAAYCVKSQEHHTLVNKYKIYQDGF